jgi:hypothetical protein
MFNERCKNCKLAVWQKLKGVDGVGHIDECECVVDCEYAGVDIFIRLLFFDDTMHTETVCPYFAQRVADESIPYVRHGESAMNIVDVVLGAVYEVRPEIEPTGENSLLYGDPYYHIEEVIGDIIQACIDGNKEPEDDPVDAVTVHTDGGTMWVNSGERCEIRISGMCWLPRIL